MTEDNKYGIEISEEHLRYMFLTSKESEPYETGGVIIGKYSEDKKCAHVSEIIEIKNKSKIFRICRFLLKGKILSSILEEKWQKTKGSEYYLGEWHSHPVNCPKPSSVDIKTMSRISNNVREECNAPLLLILGYDFENIDNDIGIFVFPRNERYIEMILK